MPCVNAICHFVVTVLALVMVRPAVYDHALRGTLDPQRDQQRASDELEYTGNIEATTEDTMSTNTKVTSRELQQTILHAVIESYSVGARFNGTLPTGISGSTTHESQDAHSSVAGGTGGLGFGGGAQPGALGIAGGTFPTLGGYTSTSLGTTTGTIGGSPVGEGLVGPSGQPSPTVSPGVVGFSGSLISVDGV